MSHPAYASRVTHFIRGKNMKKYTFIIALIATSLVAEKVSVENQKITSKIVRDSKDKVEVQPEKKVQKQVLRKGAQSLKFENKIAAVIYTGHEPIILTQKDFDKLSINGQEQTKDEIVKARKMEYEAIHVYNMPIPEEAINGYIKSLKEAHGMDDKDLKQKFEDAGYSYDEGLDELRRMLVMDSLFNFKIKSRLVVPEDEVRAYYKNNVQELPATYNIRKGFLSAGILTSDEIENLKKTGKHSDLIDWMSPYWLAESDLAQSLQHMKTLEPEAIVAAIPTGNGHEVIQLVKKKLKRTRTFEESYKDIADMLRKPLFEKLVKEYEQDLKEKYEVVFY
jgi:hypothetical protein